MLAVALFLAAVYDQVTQENPDALRREIERQARSGELQDAVERERVARVVRGRQDVEDYALAPAPRRSLPAGGSLTVRVGYGDGAFYLYDRSVLRDFRDGQAWEASMEAARDGGGLSGVSGGVATVLTCCEGGEAPLRIERHAVPPAPHVGAFDGVAEHDLDLPDGDLVVQPNGDGAAELVIAVGPGRYRIRISERLGKEMVSRTDERFQLDLWPRAGAVPAPVLKASPGS